MDLEVKVKIVTLDIDHTCRKCSLVVVPEEVGMVFMAGRTADVGDIKGLTGDTAMDRGTGEEGTGVDPVGVVLPLFGCNKE